MNEKNKILNIFLVITTLIMIFSFYSYFYKKEHPVKNYLYPENLKIIYEKEKFSDNYKIYFAIPEKEKNKIWENFYNFLQLEKEEKSLLLQNYIEFLNYDKEKRENLRKIYNEIFGDM
ncbi:MAG: hypothetical protein NC833_02720 [Candidatus Omnitrophica bacterium]|nr:hypothetical protein [Candidatus Omnitrophota bacterium]